MMAEEEKKPQEVEEPASPAPSETEGIEGDSPSGEDIQEITTLHERTIAAMSYIGFLAIVPFYLKKDSKFCRFHGKQGLLFALIFFFGKLLSVLDILMDLFLILQVAIAFYMGFKALSGQWKKFWFYNASCELEKAFSLKSKTETEEEGGALAPGQIKSDKDN